MVMSKQTVESALSRQIAGMLAASWSHAPLFGHSTIASDLEQARDQARMHLDLAVRAVRDIPNRGWNDLRLASAAAILAAFGDAYAFASLGDPSKIPSGSLPDLVTTEQVAIAGEIDRWCAHHGHPLPIDAVVADGIKPTSGGALAASDQLQNLRAVGLAVDPFSLMDAERPDWEGYEAASADAAERLDSWVTGYRSVFQHLESNEPRAYLKAFREQSSPAIISEIAFARRNLFIRLTNGAEAEAIIATAYLLLVTRCAYLLTTAANLDDVAALHTVPLNMLESVFETSELTSWLEAARRSRGEV
jgi:hypothetical protein